MNISKVNTNPGLVFALVDSTDQMDWQSSNIPSFSSTVKQEIIDDKPFDLNDPVFKVDPKEMQISEEFLKQIKSEKETESTKVKNESVLDVWKEKLEEVYIKTEVEDRSDKIATEPKTEIDPQPGKSDEIPLADWNAKQEGVHIKTDDSDSLLPPRKRLRTFFTVGAKSKIIDIFKKIERSHTANSYDQLLNLAAEEAGIDKKSLYKILREYRATLALQPGRISSNNLKNIGYKTSCAVLKLIHSFYLKNEIPTIQTILKAIEEDKNIPNFKERTLKNLLGELGLRHTKRTRNVMLSERGKIVLMRCGYLELVREYRLSNRKIYYLDEMYINKDTCNKTKNLIAVHIASETGFVKKALFFFESKKKNEDLPSQAFEKWFKNTLDLLEENSVIIMDNASCHNRKLKENPSFYFTSKVDIQAWLRDNKISYKEDMVKCELYDLVKKSKIDEQYVVEELAKATNRSVLRLPRYHYELNPVELIWEQLKTQMTVDNVDISVVKTNFQQLIENITPQNWEDIFDHVLKIEQRLGTLDHILDTIEDSLLDPNASTSDSDDSDW